MFKNLIHHYGNPLHIACRLTDVAAWLNRHGVSCSANMREIMATKPMRAYSRIFQALAY